MKRLLITVVAVIGLSVPAKADVNTDLLCVSALSKARDHLIDLHGARHSGSAPKDYALRVFTDVQDRIFLKYPIGHSVVNTRNMDKIVKLLYSNKDIVTEASLVVLGIRDWCVEYRLLLEGRTR